MHVLQGLIGLTLLLALAWAMSENRKAVNWRLIGGGMALFVLLAVVMLKLPVMKDAFGLLNRGLIALVDATKVGTSFVFGYLGGGTLPFEVKKDTSPFILALEALPLVLVISALSALLFYWRILPWIVRGFSVVLEKTLGIGGAVGVSTAANVFMGMVESPLVVKPYLARLNRGELFMVMTAGMASTAGSIMALYAGVLSSTKAVPDAIGHILVCSFISAPIALVISALMVPPVGDAQAGKFELKSTAHGAMDAVAQGTIEGIQLLLNVVGMLIVLAALVALGNQLLSLLPSVGGKALTLQGILGGLMAPLAWASGVPWAEAQTAGSLLGTKTVLNEFVAYLDMSKLPPEALSEKTRIVMTYVLCGFANFGSLGIMIGGFTAMVPERRMEVIQLGGKSIIAGTLATCACGSLVSMLL
jgi:concentrative nucleoside transporter, CNT family